MDQINEKKMEMKIKKIISYTIFGIVALMIIFGSFGTVGAGERGVFLQFGAVKDKIFGEGLYFKIPFVQSVVKMDVQTQKDEVPASASSKDLQMVTSKIALNYHPAPDLVNKLWQEVGENYNTRIIGSLHSGSSQGDNCKIYCRRTDYQERRGKRTNQRKSYKKVTGKFHCG